MLVMIMSFGLCSIVLAPGNGFQLYVKCGYLLCILQDAFIASVFGYNKFYSARFTIFSLTAFLLICPIISFSYTDILLALMLY